MTASHGVVRLTNGASTWSGIVLEPSGLIITTTSNLGSAPAVQYATSEGMTGQAWIVGRDDSTNIALFRVVNAQGEFAVVKRGDTSVPEVGKELATIQYGRGATTPIINNASVDGSRQSVANGYTYFRLRGRHTTGAEGGAVVDEFGDLRGMRMDPQFMVDIEIALPNESYALTTPDLLSAVPRIDGEISIDVKQCRGVSGTIPPLPNSYFGTITVDGGTPPANSRIYARVVNSSRGDVWSFADIRPDGAYNIPVQACDSRYNRSPIEFWLDGVKAPEAGVFGDATGRGSRLDLTFPAVN